MKRPSKQVSRQWMLLVSVATLLLAACATRPTTSTASSIAPAPVVNCDDQVLDVSLAHVPTPPNVPSPARAALVPPADLLRAYQALYGYVSGGLLPWAGTAVGVWTTNDALRQRTARCLTTLRQQHVIN